MTIECQSLEIRGVQISYYKLMVRYFSPDAAHRLSRISEGNTGAGAREMEAQSVKPTGGDNDGGRKKARNFHVKTIRPKGHKGNYLSSKLTSDSQTTRRKCRAGKTKPEADRGQHKDVAEDGGRNSEKIVGTWFQKRMIPSQTKCQ